MKIIDIILEDDNKEAALFPPSLSRQGNVRGALGPGAFPVSAPGQHCDDDTRSDTDDTILSEQDEEQPPSTNAYLAEATVVTDGHINQEVLQSNAAIMEVYEGRVVLPHEEISHKEGKGHHPVCSRRTILLVAIAVVLTGAVVGAATYAAMVMHLNPPEGPPEKFEFNSEEAFSDNRERGDDNSNDHRKGGGGGH